jgi:hypothetical protein
MEGCLGLQITGPPWTFSGRRDCLPWFITLRRILPLNGAFSGATIGGRPFPADRMDTVAPIPLGYLPRIGGEGDKEPLNMGCRGMKNGGYVIFSAEMTGEAEGIPWGTQTLFAADRQARLPKDENPHRVFVRAFLQPLVFALHPA